MKECYTHIHIHRALYTGAMEYNKKNLLLSQKRAVLNNAQTTEQLYLSYIQISTIDGLRISNSTDWIEKQQGHPRTTPNIHRITRKARVFQKDIHFSFIGKDKGF